MECGFRFLVLDLVLVTQVSSWLVSKLTLHSNACGHGAEGDVTVLRQCGFDFGLGVLDAEGEAITVPVWVWFISSVRTNCYVTVMVWVGRRSRGIHLSV